jgi:hypothetical protein
MFSIIDKKADLAPKSKSKGDLEYQGKGSLSNYKLTRTNSQFHKTRLSFSAITNAAPYLLKFKIIQPHFPGPKAWQKSGLL